LAYSQFKKESGEWINQANAVALTDILIKSGMNVDVDQALNIKQLMPVLDKSLAGTKIKVTDSTGKVYEVPWSTDTKDGALAPLFQDWDGKSYAPGQKPSVADSNLDAMFYAMNESLVNNGQAPLTMSQFRGLVTGPMSANPLNVTDKPLTQNNIKAWVQDATKAQNKANEIEQGKIKVTDATSAANATSMESFSEATPLQMKEYLADPTARKNMQKLGFQFLEDFQGLNRVKNLLGLTATSILLLVLQVSMIMIIFLVTRMAGQFMVKMPMARLKKSTSIKRAVWMAVSNG